MIYKKFLYKFICVFLTVPILLQYILHWRIFYNDQHYSFSIYAIYLIVYLFIQFTFAYFNNKNYINDCEKKFPFIKTKKNLENNNLITNHYKLVNIIIVGYKENKEYYRNCLESIKTCYIKNPHLINKIIAVIDGNNEDDLYMMDIFNDVFTESSCNILLSDFDKDTFNLSLFNKNTFICISQNHNGKRECMFTAFSTSILEKEMYNNNTKYVFCTDSDTIIDKDCIKNMVSSFEHYKNKNIGSICGNLSIFNKYDSFISFLTNLRYWYAFNLERAYQSYTGEVLCVSGPIGMYDINLLTNIIDDWKNQTFLGNKCTYGDDRHLTNKILETSHKIIYIPNSSAKTETPSDIYRFFKQQVRWNKSAFREFFWTIDIIHKHSIFMTFNLIYMLFYPYIVIGYLLYILWNGTIFSLGFYSTLLLGIGFIKSLYGYILSKDPENLLYFLYGIVYICIVFPAKLWSLITLKDNSWGTSSRKILNKEIGIDVFPIIIWNLILIGGLCKNIYYSLFLDFSEFYYFIISSLIWIFSYIFTFFYIKYKNVSLNNLV